MNWLRNKLRAWLGIVDYDFAIGAQDRSIGMLKSDNEQLRGIIAQIVLEQQRLSQREYVGISFKIEDFETSQLKALDEFKDQKDN